MENQNKERDEMVGARRRRLISGGFMLRLLASVATAVATVVMVVASETEIVSVKVFPDLPPFNVPAPAKWHYMSAFV